MEELKDIKGLMNIEEYSLYIFIALVIICLFFIFLLIKWIFKKMKKVSPQKRAKQNLKNIDFTNAKESAYLLSKYGTFLEENEDFSYLEKYKYKKQNIEFLEEDKEKAKIFLEKHNV